MSTHPVVIVTGASRGLGRGIAIALAQAGCNVVINYAGNQKAAEECVQLCKDAQQADTQQFITIKADISNRDDRENMLAETIKQLGQVDVLVNNAGIAPSERADITEASEE